jgi:hypothetical protein
MGDIILIFHLHGFRMQMVSPSLSYRRVSTFTPRIVPGIGAFGTTVEPAAAGAAAGAAGASTIGCSLQVQVPQQEQPLAGRNREAGAATERARVLCCTEGYLVLLHNRKLIRVNGYIKPFHLFYHPFFHCACITVSACPTPHSEWEELSSVSAPKRG